MFHRQGGGEGRTNIENKIAWQHAESTSRFTQDAVTFGISKTWFWLFDFLSLVFELMCLFVYDCIFDLWNNLVFYWLLNIDYS